MYKCKFCNKEQKSPLSKGLCHSCYEYFILFQYTIWNKPNVGEIGYVSDSGSNQRGFIICHECGKAFTKLQQHIWYSHHMIKNEYCDKWGIDHKSRLTEDNYNKKMRDYAYKYNMDEQLINAGEKTRFKTGHSVKYKRSYQTLKRLKQNFRKEDYNE